MRAARTGCRGRAARSCRPTNRASNASARIHHFLADELALTPDTNALVGQADMLVTRLSGGLATWARRLEFEPFRLRVIGTAGSGKTQLAVQVMRDAVAKGKGVLYVCFNRPLADHIARVAPPEAKVANYHQLVRRSRATPAARRISVQPNVFATLEALRQHADRRALEVRRIDRRRRAGFPAAMGRCPRAAARPEGAWWWLEDPMQNLYFRESRSRWPAGRR